MKEASVVTTKVEHVHDTFAVGNNEKCDLFRRDMDQMLSVQNLEELRWYLGCFYLENWKKAVLTISQQIFAEQSATKYGVECCNACLLGTDISVWIKHQKSGRCVSWSVHGCGDRPRLVLISAMQYEQWLGCLLYTSPSPRD